MGLQRRLLLSATALLAIVMPATANARPPSSTPTVTQLVTGLASGSGSTVGPGRALYVTEGAAGRVLRVDPKTGEVTTFASGLPESIVGIGGAMDVAFIGATAYVLVTLVGADVGGSDVVGIYRVDGPNHSTPIADIGAFSISNPPDTSFFIPTGVQYALETYRGGFLVTDGHHNRVLRVSLNGEITELITFDNIVPTGLAVWGNKVYMAEAEAGPFPTCPRPAGSSRSARSRRPRSGGSGCATPRGRRIRPGSQPLRPFAGCVPERRSRGVHQRCQTLAAS